MYTGRPSQRGSRSTSNTSTYQEKPEEKKNMEKNQKKLKEKINPEILECRTDNECEVLNEKLLLGNRSKYKYKCNNGECVKETNIIRLRFDPKKKVRIFEKKKEDRIEDTIESTKFNNFHKHKAKIFEFSENVIYLLRYGLIKYYTDHGKDNYFTRTLKLQKYAENNLSDINNIKIEKDIQKILDAFQEKYNILLEELVIDKEIFESEDSEDLEKEVKEIIDIINKSGIKILGININNEEFNNLSLKQKLKYLKDNREIILKEINKIIINKDEDGFLIFKINSLLNPKNGGKLKKEKLKKEKLKKEKLKKEKLKKEKVKKV